MSDAGDQIGSDQVVDLHRGPVIRATEIGKCRLALVPRRRIRREPRASRSRASRSSEWCSHQRLAPPGIHVAAPELVWQAAQGDTEAVARQWLV